MSEDEQLRLILSETALRLEERVIERRGHALYRVSNQIGEQFALKMLSIGADDDVAGEFARELSALQTLCQAGLTGSVEYNRAAGWLMMPWVSGPSVSDVCRTHRERGTPESHALMIKVFLEMARSLGRIHSAGIVHGDLQGPHFLMTDGGCTVIDFGMARALADTSAVSEGGMVHFNSPEVCRRIKEKTLQPVNDIYSEIFSFGSLIFFLFSGQLPFEYEAGEMPYEEIVSIISQASPRAIASVASHAPQTLVRTVTRCHHHNRAERFTSMEEVARSLESE